MKTVLDCGLALRPATAEDIPYMADCIRETLKASVPPEEAALADLWTDTMTAAALDSLSSGRMQDEAFILTDGDSRKGMLWMGIHDFHSKRGLLMKVGKRRSLLDYLKATDVNAYRELIKELNIRK